MLDGVGLVLGLYGPCVIGIAVCECGWMLERRRGGDRCHAC